jgi:pantoate--beta-alanine ligase
METCKTVAQIRDLIRRHRNACPGSRVAFVPTMGALHEGHLSLLRLARSQVGSQGCVVASIFVNPTQFAPHEDLAAYPRPVESDLAGCLAQGTDLVFLPEPETIYAPDASVTVQESNLSRGLCGASRPHHFGGVCTVVAKLFLIVQPDVAVFGEKDFQQLAVIRRMVRDLHFPVEIIPAPIVREPGGLAMSSRNAYLSPDERARATVLWRALQEARRTILGGERDAATIQGLLCRELLRVEGVRIDYAAVVDPDTLEPLALVSEQVLLALAVYLGRTRLIDNLCLRSLSS